MSSTTITLLACSLALATPDAAARDAGASDHLVTASLIAEVRSVQPGHPFWVALRLNIQDGWHVNWINPGDAGLAPTVEWDLPDGFVAGGIHWPYPEKFALPELSIFGYADEVFLLSEVTPPSSIESSPTIKVRANWLACREVCIPGGADLELELAVGEKAAPDPTWARSFGDTRMALPVTGKGWTFAARVLDEKISIFAVPPQGEDVRLQEVVFFPTAQGVIENASPQKLSKNGETYRLDIERAKAGSEDPSRIRGVLVSKEGWGRIPHKALAIDIPVD